jgi:molybdopterin/thiamine biosynthesis adenylyltransferase
MHDSELWSRLQLAPEMQAATTRLQQSRVLLVGAGGLGGELAMLLAGCRIGYLTLVDADTVSAGNIPHSILFHPRHIGLPKVEVVREALLSRFPGIQVAAVPRFIQQCPAALFEAQQLIICAPDNNQTRRWVNFYAVKSDTPALFVGVGGPNTEWIGYTFLYQPAVSACFVCLDTGGQEGMAPELAYAAQAETLNLEESRRRCAGENAPVPMLAPVVSLVASYAAALALKKLAGVDGTPTYTLLDLKAPRLFVREILPTPTCSVCSHPTEYEAQAMILPPPGEPA